jgi:hypothetical protein
MFIVGQILYVFVCLFGPELHLAILRVTVINPVAFHSVGLLVRVHLHL